MIPARSRTADGERERRRVAILIAASPTRAFYSQAAALSLALRNLNFRRWQPTIHMCVGGNPDHEAYAEWYPHLRDVEISVVSQGRFEREDDWAQSDDVLRCAPRDADVLIAMDADVFPIRNFEKLLDRIAERSLVAATIAYKPFPGARESPQETWARVTDGLIDAPLDFRFNYTMMRPDAKGYHLAPFYPNFAVVFFAGAAYDRMIGPYLDIRPRLMGRMEDPDFAGQVALTLAFAASGVRTWAMPMRYNFPNDPYAERAHPEELDNVALIHYLRTRHFDRHEIFTGADHYSRFLELPLEGANRVLQESVRSLLGEEYPFG